MSAEKAKKISIEQSSAALKGRGVLQRACACGSHTLAGGECAACSKVKGAMQLQRSHIQAGPLNEVPAVEHEVLRSNGQQLDVTTHSLMEPPIGHDFSRVRAHPAVAEITKGNLALGRPGDRFEQEADRVANAVTSIPDVSLRPLPAITEAASSESAQAKTDSGKETPANSSTTAISRLSLGSGDPLPASTRAFFEPRFGSDFSAVRAHTGAHAAETARALNARAYTVGPEIVFGASEYQPETSAGKNLLAHELAHVVQQGGSPPLGGSPGAVQGVRAGGVPGMLSRGEGGAISLQIRRRLLNAKVTRPTIQRVATWGGDYTTDKYDLLKSAAVDGVDMELRFKPNKYVDAELIGMTQTARSTENGVPVPASTFYTTAAEKKA